MARKKKHAVKPGKIKAVKRGKKNVKKHKRKRAVKPKVMEQEESKEALKNDKPMVEKHDKKDAPAFAVKCLAQRGTTIYQIKGNGKTALQITEGAAGSKEADEMAASFFKALLEAGHKV